MLDNNNNNNKTDQGLSYGEKERRQQGRRFHHPFGILTLVPMHHIDPINLPHPPKQ